MWACLSWTGTKFRYPNPDLTSNIPISAQGLPASGCFTRRPSGGVFLVKVAAVQRNAHGSSSVMPTKPFHVSRNGLLHKNCQKKIWLLSQAWLARHVSGRFTRLWRAYVFVGDLARHPSGGLEGLPAVIFIRRLCGGVNEPNSFLTHVQDFLILLLKRGFYQLYQTKQKFLNTISVNIYWACRPGKEATMSLLRSKSIFISLIILFGIFILSVPTGPAWSENVKTLTKEAKKELRQAERNMFGGKNDKAIAALESIKEKLLKIKAVDPNNPNLKTLENKYKKLVKDLEKRTGKDLGGGTLMAAGTSTQPKLPPKPEAKPMPEKPAPAPAPVTGDVKTLATEASKLLRGAEKSMFSGKNDEVAQKLSQAKAMIDKIKVADPKNSQLASLEKKYGRIQKKLEAKAPKAMPAPAKVAQQAAPKKAAAPSSKLPYAARKPFSNATRPLQGLDTLFNDLADPNYRGDKDQLVERIENRIKNSRQSLDQAKALAAQKGVTSHPDFDKVEADLAAAEKKVVQAKSGYKEVKAAAAAKSKEVKADVKALMDEYKRVKSVFERATGTVIYYNDLKPVKELLAQIEAFEKNELGNLNPKLEAFGQKYGTTKDEIDKKAESMGYSDPYYRASFAYTEMAKGIENIKKTRTVMADDLVRKALDIKGRTAKGIHDFYRVKQHAKVKEWGQTAAKYEPENPRVKEFMAGIDVWIEKDLQALNAKIDKVTWPKHASNAPKDAKKLAKVVLEFLQKENEKLAAKDNDPRTMLGIIVTGPWRVFTKNILGEPIQYGLPILGAVQLASEKALNLARVYQLTMLTAEHKGVKMAPPFIGSAVGNSYYIRPSAIK